jgi:hypothetical protein
MANRLTPREAASQFIALDASLNAWFVSLPPWMRLLNGPTFTHIDIGSKQPAHWMLPYYIMIYHTCILRLHKTKLPSTPSVSSISPTLPAINRCNASAAVITHLTAVFLKNNPNFYYVNPMIVTCLFEAAATWITLSQYIPDIGHQSSHQKSILIISKALENIGTYFPMALLYKSTIQEMAQNALLV